MRRKANQMIRYIFPIIFVGFGLFIMADSSKENERVQESTQPEETSVNVSDKTQAKMLKLVSHNPETQARLFVNAADAVQEADKISLSNPLGTFEKPEGKASLTAAQASYYEKDAEVHFLDKVNFSHHSGLEAKTNQAILNTQTQDIKVNQGIEASHLNNTITSESYEIRQQNNIIQFNKNVSLKIPR